MKKSLMIVTDLDGTIVGDNFQLNATDIQTLEELSTQGYTLVAATGRSMYKVKEVLGEDPIFDYIIFSTGAGIYNCRTKKLISNHFIDAATSEQISLLLNSKKVNFFDYKPIPHNHYFHYYQNYACSEYENYLNRYRENDLVEEGKDREPRNSAQFMIIIPDDESRYETIKKELESQVSHINVIRATSPISHKYIWIEIFSDEVSKGKALEKLCTITGHNIDDVMGIGNDFNDLDFLNILQHSYVVGNAPSELLKQHKVMPSVHEAGFTHAVRDFLNLKHGDDQ